MKVGINNPRDIFGAEIQYFRLDPRYWDLTLRKFKETGLRCVTSYVQWASHLVGSPDARNPAGAFDFEGRKNPRLNLLRFLDLVQKHGLLLNFRCGPFCCNEMVHGGYPPWLVLGDPNMMVWDYANRPTQGYWIAKKEGSQPSYLHPSYLAWCRKWFDVVDAIIQPRLASNGGCITMVNLDNEISYIVRDGFLDSDYNPVNVRRGGFWHRFLHEKYGGATNLPYEQRYRLIEDVEPPRSVPVTISRDLARYTDWLEFKTWCMSEYISRLRKMHEANGVKDVIFTTNFNPHLPEGVPTRMPAFEKAVGFKGIVGYDFYRSVFMSYSGYHSMARVLKLMNASLRYTWSAEFMSGTWKKNLGESRVSDDHMRFMARCALAHGCKSIMWFMFHDRDCWGDAPISSHGHSRPSLEVLREIPRLLFAKIQNWRRLAPQTDVAIIYDLIQHQHTSIGDPMPCNDNDLHIGKPEIDGVSAGKASQEYLGLFRLLEQCGIQAGVVDLLHNSKRLQNYPIAFLPGSPVIERTAVRALNSFVRQGGRLIVTGPLPTRDERGRPIRFLEPRRFIWHRNWIAQERAEEEKLESLAFIKRLLTKHAIKPHVCIRPVEEVRWVDFQTGEGQREWRQPRNLGSAILHTDGKEHILFALNHYIDAVRFVVEFGHLRPRRLMDLDDGTTISILNGRAHVDLDRKSVRIFRID